MQPKENQARYGDGPYRHGPPPGRSFLLARRLIEAGVLVVTVGVHGWDTHASNFSSLRNMLPAVDQALSTLITDLCDRGLFDDTLIVRGANSAERRASAIKPPTDAATGPKRGFCGSAAADCEPVKSSARRMPGAKSSSASRSE